MSSQPDQEKVTLDTQMETSGIRPTELEKDSTSTTEKFGDPSVDVIAIPANRTGVYWPHVRKHIMSVIDQFPGEWSEGELITALYHGKAVLWVVWDEGCIGAAVTEITNYSDFSAVRILALGGDHFEWQPEMERLLEKFALHWGCRRIEFIGRKGWLRRSHEFKLDKVMMIKELHK